METAASSSASAHQQELSNKTVSEGFKRDAKGTMLNFNSTNTDILKLIERAYGENGTLGEQTYLQELMNIRSRMTTMITNFMKMTFDISMRIINNMRL